MEASEANKLLHKRGRKAKVETSYTSERATMTSSGSSDTSSVSSSRGLIGSLAQTGATLVNKFNAPDSVKQGNNATGDLLSKGLDVIYYVDMVTNIEEIAKAYETIGYKVDRIVNGSPISNNRQLYNYVQCSEIELDITMLSSDSIINDLSDRFLNGLRLWNVDEMKINNLNLGDVCVYDNMETYEEVTNE